MRGFNMSVKPKRLDLTAMLDPRYMGMANMSGLTNN